MLIGIDASRANRKFKSGTEWYSFYIIRWLAKIDDKNQYILYTDKPLTGLMLDLISDEFNNECGYEVKYENNGWQKILSPYNNFRAKILKWPYNFLWTQGRLSLEMLLNKPDVLFIPSHTLPVIHPKNSIVTIHDVGFKRVARLYDHNKIGPDNKGGKKIINILVKLFTFKKNKADTFDYLDWSTAYALLKAKKIITVSNFSKKEILEIYGSKKNISKLQNKIKVIYNGYNYNLYKKISDKIQIEKVLKEYDITGPYLLYVGRLDKKKNLSKLIEAFYLLKQANKKLGHKLVLVGAASFGYDEVNYMIREFRLDNEVIITGWVKESAMPYIYNQATAFIFPSYYEGFGIPLLQAMACDVPIAASNAASIPEVVGEAAVLFNPYNVEAISRAMAEVILNQNLRKKLISFGRKQVKKYSMEKCVYETLKEIISI